VEDRHIAVTTSDGAVTLSGYVPSYFQKTRAVTAAEQVYGVKAVADELEVRLHESHLREDSEIAKTVAHILEWNTVLASQHIQAKVSNGHVSLIGEVAWNYQREEAGHVVEGVLGVKWVANRITVGPHALADEVEKHIRDALARNAAVNARQVHVTTVGNTAVLTGSVHSLAEDRIAKKAVWQARGIAEIEDRLVVQA
jgi:osmotically-inducible protein OsmY